MRKTSQPSTAAQAAAVRTASFASSSSRPSKARVAIRIVTVKPIPATTPAAARPGQVTGSRSPLRVASQEAPQIPTGLPTT